ncbi:MAG: hypothetical protein H6666_15025 [Ardenticatenaceae bacterium]|nr:hypothetical protein [Anaerolineales bacterium]MCB8919226.1 hypothetical protein [Ardenticatenaceae bacterium]
MKLFIAFLLLVFLGGMFLWKAPSRQRSWLLLGLCLLLTFAYYFLNQI